jgi:hypothetical protein
MVLAVCIASVTMSQEIDVSTYRFLTAKVTINGKSTLHDWTVEAPEILDIPDLLQLVTEGPGLIDTFGFKVGVATMDGGRGAAMNDKIHKALQSKSHPYIIYHQEDPAHYEIIENQLSFVSTGLVSMAGFSKDESIQTTGVISDGVLTLTATHPLLMSEYDIEPPSAMFGQIQTKDDISITIEIKYESP